MQTVLYLDNQIYQLSNGSGLRREHCAILKTMSGVISDDVPVMPSTVED